MLKYVSVGERGSVVIWVCSLSALPSFGQFDPDPRDRQTSLS